MNLGSSTDLARIRDAATCRAWLDKLAGGPFERLERILALFAHLGRQPLTADPTYEVLEQVRGNLIQEVESAVRPLQQMSLPLQPSHLAALEQMTKAMDGLHQQYRRSYTRMIEAEALDTRSIIPGAANALRVVMPLARALDTQARLIAMLLKLRVQVQPAQWDAFCLLGRYMRQSTFLDEVLIDPLAFLKPCTSRATFVYPLLLRLAKLPERTVNQSLLIDKLAKRWAARVGVRIDTPPNLAEAMHGPSIELSPDYSVRLDTTRLLKSLFERKQEWLSDATGKTTSPFTRDELALLVGDLEQEWSATFSDSMGDAPAHKQMRIRFGLPRLYGQETATGDTTLTPAAAAPMGYTYGRLEQNTILKMALGAGRSGRSTTNLYMSESESTRCLAVKGHRYLLERHLVTPSSMPGSLVGMLPVADDADQAQPDMELGVVVGVEQLPAPNKGLSVHQIAVQSFGVPCQPVGVREVGTLVFYDAFLLDAPPFSEIKHSLVARRGLVQSGMEFTLRDHEQDRTAYVGELMDQGRAYERFAIKIKK